MSGSFESVQWNACVHRLDLNLYSHPKEFFGERSQNPCQLQEKNPLYQKRPPRWPSGKASASRAEDPGFESHLSQDFFGVKSYQ